MSHLPLNSQEELLCRVIFGQAAPAERVALAELLARDPSAAAVFEELSGTWGLLGELEGAMKDQAGGQELPVGLPGRIQALVGQELRQEADRLASVVAQAGGGSSVPGPGGAEAEVAGRPGSASPAAGVGTRARMGSTARTGGPRRRFQWLPVAFEVGMALGIPAVLLLVFFGDLGPGPVELRQQVGEESGPGPVQDRSGEPSAPDGKQAAPAVPERKLRSIDLGVPYSDCERRIREQLARKVSFEFVETPFAEALDFVHNLIEVPIVIDPGVGQAGQPPPLSLRVTDMKVELALYWILRLSQLSVTVRHGALYVSKPVAGEADAGKIAALNPGEDVLPAGFRGKVSFHFVDTPLEEALNFLNTLCKANIVLDPQVLAEGAGKAPISLKVVDMELQTAFRLILRLARLDYEFRREVVFVSKQRNLLAGNRVARVRPIAGATLDQKLERVVVLSTTELTVEALLQVLRRDVGLEVSAEALLAAHPGTTVVLPERGNTVRELLARAAVAFQDLPLRLEEDQGRLTLRQLTSAEHLELKLDFEQLAKEKGLGGKPPWPAGELLGALAGALRAQAEFRGLDGECLARPVSVEFGGTTMREALTRACAAAGWSWELDGVRLIVIPRKGGAGGF